MGKKILLTSAFQEINSWEKENGIQKFVPEGSLILKTENTDLVLIIEKVRTIRGDFTKISLLDRIVEQISENKNKKISKNDAKNTARVLREQAKKLAGLSETYNIRALALEANKDVFNDVVKDDPNIKKILDNPF